MTIPVSQSWLSSSALAELNLSQDTNDPKGGKIHRESDTQVPSGVLEEAAHFQNVWSRLPTLYSEAERKDTLRAGMNAFLQQGVSTAVDMAMGELNLRLLRTILHDDGRLPLRIVCHWLVQPSESLEEDLAQVRRAKELQTELNQDANGREWLAIAGIKIIGDGVIDSCTASLHQPYHDGTHCDGIWPTDKLKHVVALADSLDLQVAIHAIGDRATDDALDALEHAIIVNGTNERRRHRIEHLELTRAESVPRMAKLGVVASVQAVHAAPAVQTNWRAMLGQDARCDRAFAYRDFFDHGAIVALGTDAPTTSHPALHNLYVAQTRKQPEDDSWPATTPQYALPLLDALNSATIGGAVACRQEDNLGSLEVGKRADFVVCDVDIVTEGGAQALLKASVLQTWVGGHLGFGKEGTQLTAKAGT